MNETNERRAAAARDGAYRLLDLLRDPRWSDGGVSHATTTKIAAFLKISERTVKRYLDYLEKAGKIRRTTGPLKTRSNKQMARRQKKNQYGRLYRLRIITILRSTAYIDSLEQNTFEPEPNEEELAATEDQEFDAAYQQQQEQRTCQ